MSYVHAKDIDPDVQSAVIENQTDFMTLVAKAFFVTSAKDQLISVTARQLLLERGYHGWLTVEQDCDPTLDISPLQDAIANRQFLSAVGF